MQFSQLTESLTIHFFEWVYGDMDSSHERFDVTFWYLVTTVWWRVAQCRFNGQWHYQSTWTCLSEHQDFSSETIHLVPLPVGCSPRTPVWLVLSTCHPCSKTLSDGIIGGFSWSLKLALLRDCGPIHRRVRDAVWGLNIAQNSCNFPGISNSPTID